MTHYQKIATMIFRIIGVFFLISSALIGLISLLLSLLFVSVGGIGNVVGFFSIFSWLPTLIFGIVFFSSSRLLAKWVCLDFYKINE